MGWTSHPARNYQKWVQSDIRKQRIEELKKKYPNATNIESVADGYCAESEIIQK